MSIGTRFPAAVDTVVVGAGTAGAVVIGRLAAGSSGTRCCWRLGRTTGRPIAVAGRTTFSMRRAARCVLTIGAIQGSSAAR